MLFCKALGVPEDLLENEQVGIAMMLMINSHRITKNRQMSAECKEVMDSQPSHLWVDFFEIFNENSRKLRVKFFRNTFVQFLWNRFRVEYRS